MKGLHRGKGGKEETETRHFGAMGDKQCWMVQRTLGDVLSSQLAANDGRGSYGFSVVAELNLPTWIS